MLIMRSTRVNSLVFIAQDYLGEQRITYRHLKLNSHSRETFSLRSPVLAMVRYTVNPYWTGDQERHIQGFFIYLTFPRSSIQWNLQPLDIKCDFSVVYHFLLWNTSENFSTNCLMKFSMRIKKWKTDEIQHSTDVHLNVTFKQIYFI